MNLHFSLSDCSQGNPYACTNFKVCNIKRCIGLGLLFVEAVFKASDIL